jgi:DNA-binding NtrC family response regulator
MIPDKFILCIEPEGEICLLLSMMLHRDDLLVHHVRKLDEADDFFTKRPPALVVIENTFTENDIANPIAEIKQKAPDSKILMVSSIDSEVAEKASSAGVDLFLTRPFSKSALINAMLSMLE